MGIAERKEKEGLKALILGAAEKLSVQKGLEHTTTKNIAQAIEHSVGTVYVHFKDKNDIFHELRPKGSAKLGSEMRTPFHVTNPMARA